jgi:hypothetical protein
LWICTRWLLASLCPKICQLRRIFLLPVWFNQLRLHHGGGSSACSVLPSELRQPFILLHPPRFGVSPLLLVASVWWWWRIWALECPGLGLCFMRWSWDLNLGVRGAMMVVVDAVFLGDVEVVLGFRACLT